MKTEGSPGLSLSCPERQVGVESLGLGFLTLKMKKGERKPGGHRFHSFPGQELPGEVVCVCVGVWGSDRGPA